MRSSMTLTAICCVLLSAGTPLLAGDSGEAAPTPPPLPKQYIFPAQGQTAEAQAADEATCSQWAIGQVGYDPFAPPPTATPTPPPPTPDRKSRRRGAVRGAAAGYIIGDLTNDEGGEGAAIGAVVGSRSAKKKKQAQQQAAAAASAEKRQREIDAIKAQQLEFLKARTACLEAKGYTVK